MRDSAYAWSQRILHVQSIDCQSNVISCPKQRHFMSKAIAKATSFHVHPRKAKACLPSSFPPSAMAESHFPPLALAG
jgi:hypothetical protein